MTASTRRQGSRSQQGGTASSAALEANRERTRNAIVNAPLDINPVIAIANLLIGNTVSLGMPENSCVYTCLVMRHTLELYQIDSHFEAVTVTVETVTDKNRYGPQNHSWYIGSLFHGHAVLVMPTPQRFIDPTVGQFDEIIELELAATPVMGRIPLGGANLGFIPLCLPRENHTVTYLPHPRERDAWRHPEHDEPDVVDMIHEFGQDFADSALDCFRQYRPEVITQSPHPGIRQFASR